MLEQFAIVHTSWGAFGMVVRGRRLVATFLPQTEGDLRKTIRSRCPDAIENADVLRGFQGQVLRYFEGARVRFDVEVDLEALPAFRRRVLQACRGIPHGRTASYGDLARAVGKPGAARAVGGAMASNPLPLVIPCHRVLRSDDSIGGFSSPSGIREKARMLSLEGVLPAAP
ncbi:MAG: methylated-DNA--[protein]-cysteine S-methyltransferase [Planctomycetes bacterium]|nr:methylated-DNA--[protein]-cysteine S-methyltransferase [Planctomycetota bacterium]